MIDSKLTDSISKKKSITRTRLRFLRLSKPQAADVAKPEEQRRRDRIAASPDNHDAFAIRIFVNPIESATGRHKAIMVRLCPFAYRAVQLANLTFTCFAAAVTVAVDLAVSN